MLDIETLGTTSNCPILSIGAVEFDRELGLLSEFHKVIDLKSCLDRGMNEINGDTFYFWLKQSDEARNSLYSEKRVDIKDALIDFQKFLGKDNLQIWGNGSDFDNVILLSAFRKFKVNNPWKYVENRCFRTLKYSFDSLDIKREGVHHNSLDDAKYQAKYLIALVEKYKLKHVL